MPVPTRFVPPFRRFRRFRRPPRGVVVAGAAVVAFALAACEAAQETGIEQAPAEDTEPGRDAEADASAPYHACDALEERLDGDLTAFADRSPEALSDVEELAWLGSGLASPQMDEEISDADGFTVFAPWDPQPGPEDTGSPEEAGDEPPEQDVEAADPRAFVHTGSVLSLDELLEQGVVRLADGTDASVEEQDGRVWVETGGQSVDIVCADVPLGHGVMHVTEGVLLPPEGSPQDPDAEIDHEFTTPPSEVDD